MKKIYFFVAVIIILILFIQTLIPKPETLKIGLVAGLSGKYSTLGTNVKNGVLLALDEINYEIGDTKIELILQDDQQNSKETKKIIQNFIDNDVRIIIGNTTSSMAKHSIELVNKEKNMLLFSPTVSSNLFSRKDDNFIRLQVSNTSEKFQNVSEYFQRKGFKNIIAIYDSNNMAYSNDLMLNLEKSLIKNGCKKYVDTIKINNSFESIVKKIKENDVDVIVVIASSIESAKLIQYLKLNNINKTILGSIWARSQNFLDEGGKAVEKVLFISSYDNNSKNKRYLKFRDAYEKKYNKKPSVFSIQAYETTKIIIDTLKKDINPNNLKKNILKKKVFSGLQGDIKFDEFGDISRAFHLVEVNNSQYKRIDEQ